MTAATAEAEIIEGVVTEVREEERGLAIVPQQRAHLMSGLGAVALLSDEDFDRNLTLLTKGKQRAQAIQKAILTPGVDYGTVPGIDRPFLHKPGAEVMEKAYGLATSYTVERKVGDGVETPALEYIVHAKVHLGDTDGPIVAEGVGSCNTHESKYRFRRGERECPDCHKPAIIKGKADGKLRGKWWCASFKDGCGHAFDENDPRLKDQQVGQVENDNPYDLANTILKMARKRAGVDGILTATGTSGLFTQDEDSPAVQPAGNAAPAAGPATQQGQAPAGGGQPASAGSNRAALPKIPQGITDPTAVGQVRLAGLITITDKQRTDGALRQTPTGAYIGFQFDWNEGGKIATVTVHRELAEQLAAVTGGNPSSIHGTPVIVAGEMWADPWKKRNAEGIEEQMPPARRIVAQSIEAEDWKVPEPSAIAVGLEEDMTADDDGTPAAAPAKKGKAKPAEAKQTTVADAAHEANQATAPSGPGMAAEDFNRALQAGNVAGVYALSVAKERYGVETLFGLTDAQRLELAGELGLLADEED